MFAPDFLTPMMVILAAAQIALIGTILLIVARAISHTAIRKMERDKERFNEANKRGLE